jgi:hypothetical protein
MSTIIRFTTTAIFITIGRLGQQSTCSSPSLLHPLQLLRREKDDSAANASSSSGEEGPVTMLHVNFDPLLVRLLREVKYFLLLDLQVRAETTPGSTVSAIGFMGLSWCRILSPARP